MRSCVHLLCAFALLHAAAFAAEEPKKEPAKDYDVAILEHFKVKTDTQSLLKWLSDKSSDDETLLAIPDLIKQLGSEQFRQRDAAGKKLVAIGLPALWPLRDAMNDKDPERARLAKQCLERMDRGTHTVSVPPCSIRLLMRRKPDGLLDLLLRYLPYTTDPEVEEDIYYNIDELRDGKIPECLLKALDDKVPARRALAGCIIAKNAAADQKKRAEKLLNDPDPNVRLRTAQGFLAAGEKTGIPILIDLLDQKPVSVAWQAEELLSWAANDRVKRELVWDGSDRATKAKSDWETWWSNSRATFDHATFVKERSEPQLLWPTGFGAGRLFGGRAELRWTLNSNQEMNVAATRYPVLLSSGRVVGIRDHFGESEIDAALPIEKYTLCELSLNGSALKETTWRSRDPISSIWNVAPNGLTTCVTRGVIGLQNLQATSATTEFVDLEPLSNRQVRGLVGKYAHLCLLLEKLPHSTELLLADPASGELVFRQQITHFIDVAESLSTSGPDILIAGTKAIWRLQRAGHRRIEAVLPVKERIRSMCGLRNGVLIYFANSNELRSINLEVTSASKPSQKAIQVLPGDGLSTPFALVSFGFR